MKIVTINIPNQYLDCLEVLVNMGYYPSRSEVVRKALKRFLIKEENYNQKMNPQTFQSLKELQLDTMVHFK